MKKLLLFILILISFSSYGQLCETFDTVRNNAVSMITSNSARINGTITHIAPGQIVSLQLKYVRVGFTDTVTNSGLTPLRNITGLVSATTYYYYYKTICPSGSRSQTIGAYNFTTLSNTIVYAPERPTVFNHVKTDSSFIIPEGDTIVGREPSTRAQIRYKTSDNTFYGYYPDCTCWRALAIDSSGIIGLLDGKVDSVTVSGDSLFYWKVGVSYGYILPSVATVWHTTGNSDIDTSVNYIGTTNAVDLPIRTNGTRKFTVNTNGAWGIGTPPDYGTSGYIYKSLGDGSAPGWVSPGSLGLTVALSALTAGVASNDIDNTNNPQIWRFTGLTQYGLSLAGSTTAAINNSALFTIDISGANASASRTTHTARFTNSHTGTSSINKALSLSASGGVDNISLAVEAGSIWMSPLTASLPLKLDANKYIISQAIALGGSEISGVLLPANGGNGIANNAAMTVTGVGNFSYTRTLTANTNVTFPTSGTLATLAGSEAFTNKTYNGMTVTANSGTFAVGNAKSAVINNTLSFNGTDGSTVAFGTGGTVLYNAGPLGTPSSGTLTNATGLPEGGLSTTDITTNNTSTTKHGFFPKLTSNSVYYVNNSGTLTPLTVGAANTVLAGNGVTSAPSWLATSSLSGLSYVAVTGTSTLIGATTVDMNDNDFTISDAGFGIHNILLSANTGQSEITIDGSTKTITLNGTTSTVVTSAAIQFSAYGAGALTTDGSGNITAVSDSRVKHNITSFNYGLKEIMNVHPSTFIYNQDKSNLVMPGFIAQDIQKAFGGIGVGKMKDNDMLTLNTNVVMAALVNSVKELKELNDKQQKEIDNLKQIIKNK